MRKRTAERQIRKWKKHFRILEDRKVEFDPKSEFKGQSWHGDDISVIFDYPGPPPDDYIFHEILHSCMAEIRHTKGTMKKRDKEEDFVQDLCVAMFEEA